MSSKKQIKMKQRKQKAAVFDLVIKEARKYISIDDWRDKCPESLSVAEMFDIVPLCTLHMDEDEQVESKLPSHNTPHASSGKPISQDEESAQGVARNSPRDALLALASKNKKSDTPADQSADKRAELEGKSTVDSASLDVAQDTPKEALEPSAADAPECDIEDADDFFAEFSAHAAATKNFVPCSEAASKRKDALIWKEKSKWTFEEAVQKRWYFAFTERMLHQYEALPESAVIEDAKRYKNAQEWLESSPSYYVAAQAKGIMKKCMLMLNDAGTKPDFAKLGKSKYNAYVIAVARKYENVKAWKNGDIETFTAAMGSGMYETCTAHMEGVRTEFSLQECIEDSKRFPTLRAWEATKSPKYYAAENNGWLMECMSESMTDNYSTKDIDIDACLSSLKGKTSFDNWVDTSPAMFQLAEKKGWLSRCKEMFYTINPNAERDVVVEEKAGASVTIDEAKNDATDIPSTPPTTRVSDTLPTEKQVGKAKSDIIPPILPVTRYWRKLSERIPRECRSAFEASLDYGNITQFRIKQRYLYNKLSSENLLRDVTAHMLSDIELKSLDIDEQKNVIKLKTSDSLYDFITRCGKGYALIKDLPVFQKHARYHNDFKLYNESAKSKTVFKGAQRQEGTA